MIGNVEEFANVEMIVINPLQIYTQLCEKRRLSIIFLLSNPEVHYILKETLPETGIFGFVLLQTQKLWLEVTLQL